jgi:hypothetical protein
MKTGYDFMVVSRLSRLLTINQLLLQSLAVQRVL